METDLGCVWRILTLTSGGGKTVIFPTMSENAASTEHPLVVTTRDLIARQHALLSERRELLAHQKRLGEKLLLSINKFQFPRLNLRTDSHSDI